MSAGKRVNILLRELEENYQRELNDNNLIDHPLTKLGFMYNMKINGSRTLIDEDFDVRRMMRSNLEHEINRLILILNDLRNYRNEE